MLTRLLPTDLADEATPGCLPRGSCDHDNRPDSTLLSPGPDFTAFLLYAATVLALGAWRLRRRDV